MKITKKGRATKETKMSAITKIQRKNLMKDIKEGRILKRVLTEPEETWLFAINDNFKSTIILYNLEKKHNIKNDKRDYAGQIASMLKDRNILLGRKKEDKLIKKLRDYRAGTDYGCYENRKKMKRDDLKKRNAEIVRYEAMGALWCGTPLCEDVIGEIMSYL